MKFGEFHENANFHFFTFWAERRGTRPRARVVSKNADPPGGPPTAAAARPAASSSLLSHRTAHSREFARVNPPFTPTYLKVF